MDLVCEDLANVGLRLVPPSRRDYAALFADIVGRLARRVGGAPPVPREDMEFLQHHHSDGNTAILRNEFPSAAVALAFVWTVQMPGGLTLPLTFRVMAGLPVFFPFKAEPIKLPVIEFWEGILPKSTRVVSSNGLLFGDNTDVRAPQTTELWHGAFVYIRARRREYEDPLPLKLTLDGAFFADGGFAGPNDTGLWEEVTELSEGYSMLAAMARRALRGRLSKADFIAYLEELSSAGSETRLGALSLSHGQYAKAAGREARELCISSDIETALERIAGWLECQIPRFYRLTSSGEISEKG